MSSIYVTGSLAFDRVMNFPGTFSEYILPDKIHMLNVCFPIGKLEVKRGGTAGNIAYCLAMLGETATIIASVGKDFDGYRVFLQKLGLPLDGINTLPGEFTAGAYITTDQNSNQITGFHPAAMLVESVYDFPALEPDGDIAIIAPTNVGDMIGHAAMYKENKVRYIFDPGQQITSLDKDALLQGISGAEVLVSNDYELELIFKITGLSMSSVLQLTKAVITTFGEQGSRVVRRDGTSTNIPSVKADTLADPTGAGDSYRAGILKGLRHGMSLEDAAKLGAACASFCVEKYGTQAYYFDQAALEGRLLDTFNMPLPFSIKPLPVKAALASEE